MTTTRYLNRLLSFIPLVWVLGFLVMVVIGFLKLHKIPVYGIDPDPYALHIDWINSIMLVSFVISLFTIPLTIVFSIVLLLQKVQFTRSNKLALFVPLLSVVIFLLCKYGATNLFEWVLD